MSHHPFSPSKLHRLQACPGSHKLSAGIPEQESEFAAEGTMLHARVVSGDLTGLDNEQAEAVESCRKELAGFSVLHERHLTVCDDLEILTEGTADAIAIDGARAYLWDWKFGRGEVEEAAGNIQLAAYALGVAQEFGVSEVVAILKQPRLNARSEYTFRDFDGILMAIREIRLECESDGLHLCAGPHCRYCPAAGTCPEIKREAGQLVEVHSSQITDPTEMALQLSRAKAAKAMAKAVEEWARSVEYHALRLGQPIPGWEAKDGARRRNLCDLNQAFARCQTLGISAEEFVGCCTASLPALESLAENRAKEAGRSKKEGKQELLALLSDLIECKASEPKMVEV